MGLLASFLKKSKKGMIGQEWAISLESKITPQLTSGFLEYWKDI